jgi:hypothetical protein
MTALPTSAGYMNVTPDELITLVTQHKNDKVTVAFTGVDEETNKCTYIVRWKV